MTDSLLFVGIDGWDLRLADYYGHPWWDAVRDEAAIVRVQKPELIESGDIATASSPRLWARIYTGTTPHTNGVLGFWERLDADGNVQRADVPLSWIRDNRCEKLVMADDLLTTTIWEHVALGPQDGLTGGLRESVGLTAPWFSYPLSGLLKETIDENGGWALGDFPFPKDHPKMDRDRMVHPPDAWPGDDFQEEVGAGARVSILVHEDPEAFYEDLLQQDRDRYRHVEEQLRRRGTPTFTTTLTRSTDGMAHQFRKDEDIREHYPERLRDGEENLRRVYDVNFDGIGGLVNEGDFDHVVIGGDHGCGLTMTDDGPEFHGDDHQWPAFFAIISDAISGGTSLEARYEDLFPTMCDLMEIPVPDHVEGTSLLGQAATEDKLRDLGYL